MQFLAKNRLTHPLWELARPSGNSSFSFLFQRSSVRNSPVSAILCALAVFDTLVLVLDFLNNYLKFYLDTFLLGYKVCISLTFIWNFALQMRIFTARKRSLGQGNIYTSISLSVDGGEVCIHGCLSPEGRGFVSSRESVWSRGGRSASSGVWGLPPLGEGVCIQGGWADPLPHGILRDTVNKRAVRTLLEYILVCLNFTAESSIGHILTS